MYEPRTYNVYSRATRQYVHKRGWMCRSLLTKLALSCRLRTRTSSVIRPSNVVCPANLHSAAQPCLRACLRHCATTRFQRDNQAISETIARCTPKHLLSEVEIHHMRAMRVSAALAVLFALQVSFDYQNVAQIGMDGV